MSKYILKTKYSTHISKCIQQKLQLENSISLYPIPILLTIYMSFSRALSNIFKLVPHAKISLINGYIRENTDSNFDVPKEIVV